MILGIPLEVKAHETRVGLGPPNVAALIGDGHQVLVEAGAGRLSGYEDSEYEAVGAAVIGNVRDLFDAADLIVKVKEPQPTELPMLRAGQLLFTFLHLASEPALARALVDRGVTAIGYEMIRAADGQLPLLAPMSAIAGRLSIQLGAHWLEASNGGAGKLLGGVPGVARGRVTIIGAGTVGINAATVALGLGANVAVLDISISQLQHVGELFGGQAETILSSPSTIRARLPETDLLIGAVLVPGAAAPRVITREALQLMPARSVFVDVAIDQGGCAETSRVTSHHEPTYVEEGVVHYAVPNIPALVPQTSTTALTNATTPYVRELARGGVDALVSEQSTLRSGLNVHAGRIVVEAVAQAADLPYVDLRGA